MYNIGYEGYSDPRLTPPDYWTGGYEEPTTEEILARYETRAMIEIMLSDEDELDLSDEDIEYAINEIAYWLAKADGALASSEWQYI